MEPLWGRGFGARLYRRTSDDESWTDPRSTRWPGRARRRARRPLLPLLVRARHPVLAAGAYGRSSTGRPHDDESRSLDAFCARPPSLPDGPLARAPARAWPGAAGGRIEDLKWSGRGPSGSPGLRRRHRPAARRCRGPRRAGKRRGGDPRGPWRDPGEHGSFSSTRSLRRDAPSPLIVHAPGHIAAGRRIGWVVMTPDLAPTILDLLGLPIPAAPLAAAPQRQEGAPWPRCSPAAPPKHRAGSSRHPRPPGCAGGVPARRLQALVAREPDLYGSPPVTLRSPSRSSRDDEPGRHPARGARRPPRGVRGMARAAARGAGPPHGSGSCSRIHAPEVPATAAPAQAAQARRTRVVAGPPAGHAGWRSARRRRGAMISLVMAVRDALPWARRAIDSVARQTTEPFELIIVDNGSGPETSAYLRQTVRGCSGTRTIRAAPPHGIRASPSREESTCAS